jgi:hypothetical protein
VTSTNTTDSCCTEGTWIVYKVEDNGEPGIGVDKIWGMSTKPADPTQAYSIVKGGQNRDMGFPYTDSGVVINSGNVQTH